MEVVAEGVLDLLALAEAHEPVVDEHTHELVPNGLVDDRRGDRRIHTTRKTADGDTIANSLSDRLDRLLDDPDMGPRGPCIAHLPEELLENPLAVIGMGNLRMELDPEESALHRFHCGNRRVGRRGRDRRNLLELPKRRRCGSSTLSGLDG